MKIGITFPVINLWQEMTLPAIKSLKSKEHELFIVVVDNGSTDSTQAAAAGMAGNDSNFVYIRNATNLGTSTGWNIGIKKCLDNGCEYVLVINNDVLLHPEAIDRLVGRFQKGNQDKPLAMVTMINVRGDCKEVPANINNLDPKAYEATEESEHPDFSGYMISKQAYETVGEFDEGFAPAYYEDNDYHYRINLAGFKAINHPPALFYHYGSKTRTSSGTQPVTDWQFRKNDRYYVYKWGGRAFPISSESYQNPFNDKSRPFTWVYQYRCGNGTICPHNPKCDAIMRTITG